MKHALGLVVVALVACGSNDKAEPPAKAPVLSGDGKVVVPEGHEMTFVFDGTPTRLAYSWVDIVDNGGHPAFRILAQGGRRGMVTLLAWIPEGTQSFAQMKGTAVGARPDGVSFANAPVMASGTGATIYIDEVAPTFLAGRFEAQACDHGERRCDDPKQITKGTFRAFRSALSDDAAFTRFTAK